MQHRRILISLAAFLAAFMFFLPREANAYIAPGTGSYILQIALAALLGGLFALKMFWKNIKLFIANLLPGRQKHNKK